MWNSSISTLVTTYAPSRRCNCGEMSTRHFLPLTYSPVSLSVVLPLFTMGDIRVYLICYIFSIIDCHICRDIFNRIDIMYCRLPFIFGGVLPLKTLVLYIYWLRGTIQYN
jgi:hypothetical protein